MTERKPPERDTTAGPGSGSAGSDRLAREIFTESPIAIWLEDWSTIKACLNDVAIESKADWSGYFAGHPESLIELYDLSRLIDVSQAAVDVFRAPSLEWLKDHVAEAWKNNSELDGFRNTVLAFLGNHFEPENIVATKTFDGKPLYVRNRIGVPTACRDDWSRVYFTIENVTDRERATVALRQSRTNLLQAQRAAGVCSWMVDLSDERIT